MTPQNPRCPKCGSNMEEGFMLDKTHPYGSQVSSQWVEGEPESSFLFGVKTGGKEILQIATYRCQGCGYLESYASHK